MRKSSLMILTIAITTIILTTQASAAVVEARYVRTNSEGHSQAYTAPLDGREASIRGIVGIMASIHLQGRHDVTFTWWRDGSIVARHNRNGWTGRASHQPFADLDHPSVPSSQRGKLEPIRAGRYSVKIAVDGDVRKQASFTLVP